MTGGSLVAANDGDKPVIARLIQLYLYDMAAQSPFAIGKDGTYAYDFLDRFWQHPYLFHQDGQLAGFALVTDSCPITQTSPCWFMAEFFVLRPFRQHGLGRSMFHAILARHPGRWHLAVQDQNLAAAAFWSRVTPGQGLTRIAARFDDADWTLSNFDATAP